MENFKTEDILKTLLLQWKKLLVIAIISAAVGGAVSFIIKPLYKSIAVVFPVNLSPSSEESNTEQLLQWINSEEVKNAVAKKLDLLKHYDIDVADAKHQTWFNLKYKELISVNATLYESVEIAVKDQSPEMAKKIAQEIIDQTNILITQIKKERLKEYIHNNEQELNVTSKQIDSLKYMINSIRNEYNIVDAHYQSKYLIKESTNGKNLSEKNTKTLDGLLKNKVELLRLEQVLTAQITYYNELRTNIQKYHLDLANDISFTNVVSKPTLPDSKCYPIRSLIVVIFVVSALFIASLVIILQNTKKQTIA